jgi:hypothetical protein
MKRFFKFLIYIRFIFHKIIHSVAFEVMCKKQSVLLHYALHAIFSHHFSRFLFPMSLVSTLFTKNTFCCLPHSSFLSLLVSSSYCILHPNGQQLQSAVHEQVAFGGGGGGGCGGGGLSSSMTPRTGICYYILLCV